MKSYAHAKCGAKITRDSRRESCGLLPAQHGIELNRPGIEVAHTFVLTTSKAGNATS